MSSNVDLQFALNEEDRKLWDLMDTATFQTIEALAMSSQNFDYWDADRQNWTKQRPSKARRRSSMLVHEASLTPVGDAQNPRTLDESFKVRGYDNVVRFSFRFKQNMLISFRSSSLAAAFYPRPEVGTLPWLSAASHKNSRELYQRIGRASGEITFLRLQKGWVHSFLENARGAPTVHPSTDSKRASHCETATARRWHHLGGGKNS